MALNRCEFIGNLGRDPEVRSFQNGDKVCNLRIAVSEKWKDRNTGERKEKTEWVPVAIFGPLVGVAEQYLRKGSKVYISGKFTTRKWQDQSGQDRYSTEVVLQGPQSVLEMLDGPSGGQSSGGGYQSGDPAGSVSSGSTGYGSSAMADDEIPF